MIEEGLEKHREIQELAKTQVDQIKSDDTFNFAKDSYDYFKFQNKNFKEDKARIK